MQSERFGETFDRTSGIKGILENYTFSHGILRELLQNSDDAGATTQVFVLDRRNFSTQHLLNDSLADCQGPALLSMNNTTFNEADWKSIQTIGASSKLRDDNKVGKYGLGFRATYHVTDTPHILSGSSLAIFDPHETRLAGGGIKVDFTSQWGSCQDHLKAFESLVEKSRQPFNGTVIRLPLRTTEMARESRIKDAATTPDDIIDVFRKFVEQEISIIMLFLKHVSKIELRDVDDSGTKTIATASVHDSVQLATLRNVTRHPSGLKESFRMTISIKTGSNPTDTQPWLISHFAEDEIATNEAIAALWGRDPADRLSKDKLFPHVALAAPLNSTSGCDGRLFTLLPLPIHTGWPLHMHAIFALTSDRQNLRKIDPGLVVGSRDRFLVDWNRTVFQHLLPQAWAALLVKSAQSCEEASFDIFKLWPPAENSHENGSTNAYWNGLSLNLLNYVHTQELGVWPIFSDIQGGAKEYRRLDQILVASPNIRAQLLGAVSRAGVLVTCPPHEIYETLARMKKPCSFFDQKTLADSLKKDISAIDQLSPADKKLILDFLLEGDLRNIIGLPMLPLLNGAYALAALKGKGPMYSWVNQEEAELFHWKHDSMLALQGISTSVCGRLCKSLNVQRLDVNTVVAFLRTAFNSTLALPPSSNDCNEIDSRIAWLSSFWSWADRFANAKQLYLQCQTFYLLPTRNNTFRQTHAGVLDAAGVAADISTSLAILKIPFIHPSIVLSPAHILVRSGAVKSSNNVSFILNVAQLPGENALSHQNALDLQRFFSANPQTNLDKTQIALLCKLPIFPVLIPGAPPLTALRSVATKAIKFVQGSAESLPIVPETSFIDVSHSDGATLSRSIKNGAFSVTNDEELVDLTIQHFSTQRPDSLVDALMGRVLSHLTQKRIKNVRDLPFLDVVGGPPRLSPSSLVDPSSQMAVLFSPVDCALPDFGSDVTPFRRQQISSLLIKNLTKEIIGERIRTYSFYSPEHAPERREQALKLLDLLASYSFEYPPELATLPWLPAKFSGVLNSVTAAGCRDQIDVWLFDRVLPTIPKVLSSRLRKALGWDRPVPLVVIQTQVLSVIHDRKLEPLAREDTMNKLISYLARRFSESVYSAADISSMRAILENNEWVPVSGRRLSIPLLAFFDTMGSEQLKFQRVSQSLREDAQSVIFLKEMGCRDRPTPEQILNELHLMAGIDNPYIPDAIKLLRILGRTWKHASPEERSRLLIPDVAGQFGNPDQIFFEDVPMDYDEAVACRPAHRDISSSLAESLGMVKLSSIRLTADAEHDEEDFEQEEDLTNRIRNVLLDHGIDFSSNEFVANADDAGASNLTFLLDEQLYSVERILSPSMAAFQMSPAFVIHNDEVFTEKDLIGIRKIGAGSKGDLSDKIGRFGLGSLALYFFTEVPMIVSGDTVVFLDASAGFLPPGHLSRKNRRGLRMSLRTVEAKYPHYLDPFDNIFGFQRGKTFHGTIFRLPLRTPDQAKSSRLFTEMLSLVELIDKFWDQSSLSLFFTRSLRSITALHRPAASNGRIIHLWSVSATSRENIKGQGFCQRDVRLHLASPPRGPAQEPEQNWIVTSSTGELEGYENVMKGHRVPSPLKISMAARVDSFHMTEGRLMSTLPLPIQTNLPVHLHAPWILARDRRTIRLEPPDDMGRRTEEAAFNTAILQSLAPPLYLFTVAAVAKEMGKDFRPFVWWPSFVSSSQTPGSVFVESLYKPKSFLAQTDELVCRSSMGQLVSPKDALFGTLDIKYTGVHPVTQLLLKMQLPHFVTPAPFPRSPLADFRTDTPATIRSLVEENSDRILSLCQDGSLNPEDIAGVVNYLLDGNQNLARLPLLPLQNNVWTTFPRAEESPIYNADSPIMSLFGSQHFISHKFTQSLRTTITGQASVNVQAFGKEGFHRLIVILHNIKPAEQTEFTTEARLWIRKFWTRFHELALNLEDVADVPIVPVTNDSGLLHISIQYARNNATIMDPPAHLEPSIKEMGILVVDRIDPPFFYHLERAAFSLERLLYCLRTIGIRRCVASLPLGQWRVIAAWLRRNLWRTTGDPIDRSLIEQLPIWEGLQGGTLKLMVPGSIWMLPDGYNLEVLSRFLLPTVCYASYTPEMALHFPKRAMSHGPPQNYLRRPFALTNEDLPHFRISLKLMLELGSVLLIPDGTLAMRRPEELYDHRNAVFVRAFAARRDVRFIHQTLQDLDVAVLNRLGLTSAVSATSFEACARAIAEALGTGFDQETLLRNADVVYRCFNDTLPIEQIPPAQWHRFTRIPFIPRLVPTIDQRFVQHLPSFPPLVAAENLIREDFVSIAWSQRAQFRTQPSDELRVRLPSIGLPDASDVVAHLRVLMLIGSGGNHHDHSVLRDLEKTYAWLNDNAEAAMPHLLECIEEPLFLNVDSPKEAWVWRSADSLVMGMHYDFGDKFQVHEWLLNYKDLLRAAGAGEIRHRTFAPPLPQSAFDEGLRSRANQWRQAGMYFDLEMKPRDSSSVFKAHRYFLGLVVEHFETLFLGGYKEGKQGEPVHLDVSAFCLRFMLDYLYTNNIEPLIPVVQDAAEASDALSNLLDLLQLADLWDLPDIKYHVGIIIVVRLNLIAPETLDLITEAADMYHAEDLLKHCQLFREDNISELKVLSQS